MLVAGMTGYQLAPLEKAMARFAAGDDAALGDVYDLASPALFAFLSGICRDKALAEDLTQETFLRIHKARGLYRNGAAVMPWAYTIARRLFLDVLRARKMEAREFASQPASTVERANGAGAPAAIPATPEPSAEELFADRELARVLDEALTKIPEAQAAAFRLLKGQGLSLAETAAVMGTTKGAVKLRAHRAYQALRTILGAELALPGHKRRKGGGTT